MRLAIALGATLLLATPPVAAPSRDAAPSGFSHATFDTVLSRFLHNGRVDYGGLARDRGALDRYLVACADARPDDWPREEQIAFWVNAYNARVLLGVIERPGLRSVLDVGKVLFVPTLRFFRERRPTGGAARSLNDIEHGILRARYRDPRVHFVLNCASASCPVLPQRALRGATLDAELELAAGRFLVDSTRNRIVPQRELGLSSIFKWYGDDFRAAEGSLQSFVERHWPRRERFAADLPVRFLHYDWSLNGSW
ncbi:MAG TPA: DUF547 domain-containing protein [Candidatus Limnocylindria bacterium]|nr:DUF547 domain-containing protein [Candidatus Limnocylindria bacterium]